MDIEKGYEGKFCNFCSTFGGEMLQCHRIMGHRAHQACLDYTAAQFQAAKSWNWEVSPPSPPSTPAPRLLSLPSPPTRTNTCTPPTRTSRSHHTPAHTIQACTHTHAHARTRTQPHVHYPKFLHAYAFSLAPFPAPTHPVSHHPLASHTVGRAPVVNRSWHIRRPPRTPRPRRRSR